MQHNRNDAHRNDVPANLLRNARITALAGALALLVPALTATAGYVQLTQTRSLTTSASASAGSATPQNDADSETSDALGSFVDRSVGSSAGAFAQIPNPPFTASASGSGTARQSVELAPTSISGSFVGDAGAQTRVASAGGSARSTWSTTFRVDQPTPIDLDGELSVRDGSAFIAFTSLGYDASLSLTRRADGGGAEETLHRFSIPFPPFPGGTVSRPVDVSAVLEPGYVYTLAATAAATRTNQSNSVSAQIGAQTLTEVRFTLTTVPEPSAAWVLALGAVLALRRRRK